MALTLYPRLKAIDENSILPSFKPLEGVSYLLHIQETLTASFKMKDRLSNELYRSPCEYPGLSIDSNGKAVFILNKNDTSDAGIKILLHILSHIHSICMMLKSRTCCEKYSRCATIDSYEVSWTIQIHLFKMHKRLIRFICMGEKKKFHIDTPILLELLRDSLCQTYMTKENAVWVFTTISTIIINGW
jgi:hypothetical protein